MAGARDFTELTCLQLAEDLKLEVYRLCRRPAIHRDRAFRDQWLDAAASAPRNIAEGFGRHTHREFARYLSIARASLFECRQHIRDGGHRGYLSDEECERLTHLARRAIGAVSALHKYLRDNPDP